jgi:hypothetical protein
VGVFMVYGAISRGDKPTLGVLTLWLAIAGELPCQNVQGLSQLHYAEHSPA